MFADAQAATACRAVESAPRCVDSDDCFTQSSVSLFKPTPTALAWGEDDVGLFRPHASRGPVGWSAVSIALHEYQNASSLASAGKEAPSVSRATFLLEIEDNKFDCVQERGHDLKPGAPGVCNHGESLKRNTGATRCMWIEIIEADDRRPGTTGSGFSNQSKEE